MTRNLTDNAKKFLAKEPTRIGSVAGHVFYECPVQGDEGPLKVLMPDGRIMRSGYWELPTLQEFAEMGL